MPNHVHVILTTAPGTTLEKAVQLIKGSFSCRMQKELGKRCSIWQPGYFDYRIRDAADFEVRWQYVHDDPVRKHLVERPEGFPYSSANPKYTVDEIPQWLKPLSITPR